MLTLTNRIDMRPGAVPLVIHLGQYDSDFSLVFELYSSAGNFTVESGTTAMIRGTKTDGHAYDADATIDVSAKTVTVAGSEQMTAAKGRNVYELVLTKSGKVLSTANFILDVERAAMDADTIASESVLKELNAIIAGAATSTQAAADAASAADRAEDAADSVSSASAQIATNTADISDLKEDLNDKVAIPKIENYYINLTTDPVDIANPSSSSTGLAYSIVDCTEGDKFIINAVGAVTGRAWGFLDSSDFVITMADENATVTNLELTAPANAAKLVINDKGGLTSYIVGKNIIGRVDNLETDVEELQEIVDAIEPGLSDEAKEALLNCFAHVAWIDEHGQDYYDALHDALYNDAPVIKVFRGKGTSGASIVDNAKRMLSEPIPFTNTAPITMQWVGNVGYRWSMKNIASTGDIQTGVTLHYNPDEQNTGLVSWVTSENMQTLVNQDQSQFVYSDTLGACRILFANAEDLTYDLPENDPVGFITMTGTTYRIEVHESNEFI